MIFLFQADQVVNKGFQIDPTNIYQFVVGGLVVIILSLCAVVIAQYKRGLERENKIQELTVNITTVALNATQMLENVVHRVEQMTGAIDNHKTEIKTAIRDFENNIIRTVDNIKKFR